MKIVKEACNREFLKYGIYVDLIDEPIVFEKTKSEDQYFMYINGIRSIGNIHLDSSKNVSNKKFNIYTLKTIFANLWKHQ